ncbi:MAG TPA: isochorismatase family cysteine hydrolase, partial [Patescibacteria group bacterium]|nr:isochorismatase family cysteine hydrolase [Patescibacteria group bacterium]
MGLIRDIKKLRCRLFNQLAGKDAVQVLQAANDNRGELAVLVIDVQQEFCDPSHRERRGNRRTVKISDRIASMMPAFRAAGIPVYAIYFDSSKRLRVRDVDWYKFRPEAGDICVAKNADSAFDGSDIKKILERNGHKTLLACGFNRSACVGKTVVDASIEGFNVLLLSDLVGNDNNNPHD